MGAQFAAIVLGSLLSGRMGDKYGNAGAVKLALVGQTFFSALSAFAPFGFVGDPTLAATLLLSTRIGAGVGRSRRHSCPPCSISLTARHPPRRACLTNPVHPTRTRVALLKTARQLEASPAFPPSVAVSI